MASLSAFTLFVALRILLLLGSHGPLPVAAAPVASAPAPSGLSSAPYPTISPTYSNSTSAQSHSTSAGSDYWVATIQRQGTAAFNNDASYKVFRNVMDYGAKGDGSTDDTAAINNAITDGSRCGQGCDSSTTTPAIVYFPPGTYMVSKPIVQLYYTQFIGDALTLPTIKATPSFAGIAVIDSDPYDDSGNNWYTNQNNFFRQIRNFVIDLTALPSGTGAGIHWQVAQATSLQNIRFEMIKGGGDSNKQQGIFMDNGSGGFMTDLTFNGGNYGAFLGNQQFTTRNLTFNDCSTAVFMNYNWLWTFKGISINNCGVGIDMSNAGTGVGSIMLVDSKISGTPVGVKTAFDKSGNTTLGTLIIDNTDFTGSAAAVGDTSGATILAGNANIASWAQGNQYTTSGNSAAVGGSRIQETLTAPSKPAVLLDGSGKVFERSKPQYESVASSSFVSVKSKGAKGDGTTDDTTAIQAVLDGATSGQIVYFDHGAYVVTNTIKVPSNIKITGEIWPLILASGKTFQDESKPVPVFQVGQAGDKGAVEMSDLIFETMGPLPGAVMMEWNVHDSTQGASGMWDVHFRVGGTAGTQLQSDKCSKNPSAIAAANPDCEGSFLMLHVTKQASIYLENNWFWVADHELDLGDHNQINIFNGRGVLVESQGPVWMYGTSSEHSQLYNYQVSNAEAVYMAAIQTETPYYQSNPNALTPFKPNTDYSDPDFSTCTTDGCRKAWGLRVVSSSDVLMYGAGLYSFFDNYDQTCLDTESCQENMVDIQSSKVHLFGLSTKASTNMVTTPGGVVPQSDNRDNFCSTLALFSESA
ncbi:MAG: hypothetical protein M4579_001439 [Chaenotheca gracillima]|nr:MAG: hypothetical protein M4579_001439 [Chaenotheca gracillima]